MFGEDTLNSINAPHLVSQLFAATMQACPPEIRDYIANPLFDITHDALEPLVARALDPVLQEDGALGWAYQFSCADLRRNALASIQSANKSTSREQIIAFTQLYTPQWIVEFLLANAAYSQWKQPGKGMPRFNSWRLLLEGDKKAASEITILDPACGAGNFLATAFDMSINMLMQEGYCGPEACRLSRELIFGADVDPLALWVCSLSLLLKELDYAEDLPFSPFNLSLSIENKLDPECNLLGSIYPKFSKHHLLSGHFSAVVTNPPYIGRKLMSRELRQSLKSNYPECHHDLAAAFVQRSLQWLDDGGIFGVITQASILSLPSYQKLRQSISEHHCVDAAISLGTSVFPLQGGDKVNSALLLARKKDASRANKTSILDLSGVSEKSETLNAQVRLVNDGLDSDFIISSGIVDGAIAPNTLQEMINSASKLSEIADVRQGLATSDNRRFVKKIDEVDPALLGTIWQPYVKGAGSERWESPVRFAVKWENDGQEIKEAVALAYPYLKGNIKWVVKNEHYYFRPGLCFSFVNTKNLAVRRLPPGCIFDVAASAVFVYDAADEDFLLAYLNSSLMSAIAKAINPTVNMQVGDIKKLPIFAFSAQQKEMLAANARQGCSLARDLEQARSGSDVHRELIEELQGRLLAQEEKNSQHVIQYLAESYKLNGEQCEEIQRWVKKTYQPSGSARSKSRIKLS